VRKDAIRLDDIATNEITNHLAKSLKSNNCKVELESSAGYEVRFLIQRFRLKTTAVLSRFRHKPLFVEVDVNNSVLREMEEGAKKQAKRAASAQKKQDRGGYGFIFIYYVIFFIAALFVAGTTAVRQWLQEPVNQGISVGAIISITIIIYVMVPMIKKRHIRALNKFDNEVFGVIVASLEELQKRQSGEPKKIKCWNCFEEIDSTLDFCENCGKEITT